TVLFIEHDMNLVFRYADRVSVFAAGAMVAQGQPEEIRTMRAFGRSTLAADVPALAVKGLVAGYGPARVLHGLDFSLARGEMVVVIGRNGVGKTTLIETLCGLTTLQGGEVSLHGTRVEALPAYRRGRLGLGWVPQEREVFGSLTVEENLTVV